jgi:peptidoglycan/LPS O-acetylase OafA/YrhL
MNFLQPGVPGVFDGNPGNSAMNGALWTIKIELMFYASVPVLVWLCRRLRPLRVLGACIVASIAYRLLLAGHETLAVQLPGQMSYFSLGALAYYYRSTCVAIVRWLWLPALALYMFPVAAGSVVLRPFIVATIILAFSLVMREIKGPTRWGDFSYGIYIVHYPIVQTLTHFGLFESRPWVTTAIAVLAVASMAVFSWFFVERPWLQRRHLGAKDPVVTQPALGKAHAVSS